MTGGCGTRGRVVFFGRGRDHHVIVTTRPAGLAAAAHRTVAARPQSRPGRLQLQSTSKPQAAAVARRRREATLCAVHSTYRRRSLYAHRRAPLEEPGAHCATPNLGVFFPLQHTLSTPTSWQSPSAAKSLPATRVAPAHHTLRAHQCLPVAPLPCRFSLSPVLQFRPGIKTSQANSDSGTPSVASNFLTREQPTSRLTCLSESVAQAFARDTHNRHELRGQRQSHWVRRL